MPKNKQIKRFIYTIKKVNRSLLSTCLEACTYLLWFSAAPMSQKVFSACLDDKFNAAAIYANINRFHKKGFIQKIKRGKRSFVRTLVKPEQIIWGDTERLKVNKCAERWDGLWRLVIYDIPEKERGKRGALRRYLKDLGFGKIQGSCWVSPYNFSSQIYEAANTYGLLNYLCIYEGNFFAGKNTDDLVEEVWGLKKINGKYQNVIDICNKNRELIETKELTPKERYKLYFEVYELFIEALRSDPFLPKVFLRFWLRDKAQSLFEAFSRIASKEILTHLG